MTEWKEGITPTPESKISKVKSIDQKTDLKRVNDFLVANNKYNELLLLYVQKTLGSHLVVFRGPASNSAEDILWLESHPAEASYFVNIYFPIGNFAHFIGTIELLIDGSGSSSRFVPEPVYYYDKKTLHCKNDLACAQNQFSSSDQDRVGIEKILSRKKVGDWLIRRGSNKEALVISWRGTEQVHHAQFFPTRTGWTTDPKGGAAKFDTIEQVFEGMGLDLKYSTFWKFWD